MTFARQQYYAFEDGKQAGIAEGKQHKAIEAATNLLRMNILSYEQIALAQGLPREKVLELAENLKNEK